jgi:hypothetical protein
MPGSPEARDLAAMIPDSRWQGRGRERIVARMGERAAPYTPSPSMGEGWGGGDRSTSGEGGAED